MVPADAGESEAVSRKSVRIPLAARGLRVTVRLDARVQWPNGKTPENTGAFAHTTGDPEMIGAHAVRVVHGRELREVPL